MNDSYRDITWMSEEAARFRSLAEMEPIAALRRHLAALARQYDQIAADLEPKTRDYTKSPESDTRGGFADG